MNFVYEVVTNIEVGQILYGIIGCSTRTYQGVYPIEVYKIDANNSEVIFTIEQPCGFVSCSFSDMSRFVFETEEEAERKCNEFEYYMEGLFDYVW